MPWIGNGNTYQHFHYSVLGDNYGEALQYLLLNPLEALEIMFTNHTQHPHGDYIKAELHIFLVICGLPILLYKPHYLIMLIPIYCQKMFHDQLEMWGFAKQYTVEFGPIMAIGVFDVLSDIKRRKSKYIAASISVILCIAVTIRTMDQTVLFTNKSKVRIYQKAHYSRDFDIQKAHKALKKIPENAVVAAQTQYLPHLAYRDKIYQFPIIKNAKYIVFSKVKAPYPLEKQSFNELKENLNHSKEWKLFEECASLTILKRKE